MSSKDPQSIEVKRSRAAILILHHLEQLEGALFDMIDGLAHLESATYLEKYEERSNIWTARKAAASLHFMLDSAIASLHGEELPDGPIDVRIQNQPIDNDGELPW